MLGKKIVVVVAVVCASENTTVSMFFFLPSVARALLAERVRGVQREMGSGTKSKLGLGANN